MSPHRSGAVRTSIGGLVVALLALAGCTSGEGGSTSATPETSPLPDRSVGASATLEPRPAPMEVSIARIAGGPVRKAQQRAVERQVSRVLARYFDGAFLGGSYPRQGFPDAFSDFTQGATRTARADRDLLTNAALAGTVERVLPQRREAMLDLFVPKKAVAGVTARFRLAFLAERSRGADQRVVVSGRLLLTRADPGPWRVFGYDVQRSAVVATGGS